MNKPHSSEFPESKEPLQTSISGVKKFRRENPRIDYYPMPDAMAVIQNLRELNPGLSTREILDTLVIEGRAALSGKSASAT